MRLPLAQPVVFSRALSACGSLAGAKIPGTLFSTGGRELRCGAGIRLDLSGGLAGRRAPLQQGFDEIRARLRLAEQVALGEVASHFLEGARVVGPLHALGAAQDLEPVREVDDRLAQGP